MSVDSGVILLPGGQFGPAARMLARAFFDDPLMRYYLPKAADRSELLPGVLGVSLKYCLRLGEVYTTPAIEGAALWLPPGRNGYDFFGLALASLGVLKLRFAWLAYRRMREIEPCVERLHRACAPEAHWYLMVLGVAPEAQGQGIGGRLIAPVLERAALNGQACYLETMTERNVAFYRRHGFEVAQKIALPGSGLALWAMRKD